MSAQIDLSQVRDILGRHMADLSSRFGVASLALFGSQVRQEAKAGSDLDVLVRFHTAPGLFRFIELENYMADLLGVRVDLVAADALKPHISKRVLAEAVSV